MKRIRQMNVAEVVGYAFAEFGHNRFTTAELATAISSILSIRLTVGDMGDAAELVRIAHESGWVLGIPGPRGGAGFAVTELGLAAVSNVELPLEQLEKRHAAAKQRTEPARENAGPMFEMLLNEISADRPERDFVYSVAEHWMTKKWLSSKQVATLAEIAKRFDQEIDESCYVGLAVDSWTEPYNNGRKAQEKERKLQLAAAQLAREIAQKEQLRKLREDKAENRRVKAILQELDAQGKLDGLEAMVSSVFPSLSTSEQAKVAAFGGAGSNGMRVCVAALVFDLSPDRVWKNQSVIRQPGVDSDAWRILSAHSAFALKPAALVTL